MLWIISLGLCFQFLAVARALPGFSTSGLRFAFAVPTPRFPAKTVADLHVTTNEMQVNLIVYKPLNIKDPNASRRKHSFKLKRQKSMTYRFGTSYVMSKTGIYSAILLEASGPVRAILNLRDDANSAFFELLPEQSCHKTYYVAALPGYPFVAVVSFHQNAIIRVKFSSSNKKPFNVACNGDKRCAPNSQVTIILMAHSVWYFRLKYEFYEIHNSVITANTPIFAISGNSDCFVDAYAIDTCMSPMKPRQSWGREYVVPHFRKLGEQAGIHLRFNAEHFPFNVTRMITNKRVDDKVHVSHHKVVDSREILSYDILSPNIFWSDKPFGLSIFYGFTRFASVYLSMAQLVPTEQWTNGVFRAFKTRQESRDNFDTVVLSTTSDVLIPELHTRVKWESIRRSSNRTYYFTRLLVKDVKTSIYTKQPNRRLVVYTWSRDLRDAACLRVVDFYQGAIYAPHCIEGEIVDGDGVDNDCDSFIDEEIRNGKDDDDDGKVDEDNALRIEDSKWSPWVTCKVHSDGESDEDLPSRKIRSCKPSLFHGKCQGNNADCGPRPKCPTDSKEENHRVCACLEGCQTCNTDTGECTLCKDGFFSSEYCLAKCPSGWSGVGCSIPDYGILENLTHRGNNNEDNNIYTKNNEDFTLVLVILLSSVALIFCVLVFLIIHFERKKRREARANQEAQGAEDDDQEDPTNNQSETRENTRSSIQESDVDGGKESEDKEETKSFIETISSMLSLR